VCFIRCEIIFDLSSPFGEDCPEIENIELPFFLLFSPILRSHGKYSSLALLFNAFHDDACPADLALLGQKFHLVVGLQFLLDELDCPIDVDMPNSLELGLLQHWLDFYLI
jgi:hypothetical protein